MEFDSVLIHHYLSEHSVAAARALEETEPGKLGAFLDDIPLELLAKVVPLMNPQGMSEVFEKMDPDKMTKLFESLEINRIVMFIRTMNSDLAERTLNGLTEKKSNSVRGMLQHLENSVGSLMDPDVFTLNENQTLKEAMAALQKDKKRIRSQIFVVNNDRKLAGMVLLPDLMTGTSGVVLKTLIVRNITTLSPDTPMESVLNHDEWQQLDALPVVDKDAVFLGSIRFESVRSILVRSGKRSEGSGQEAVSALGELYRIGLSGLVRSATGWEPSSNKT